MTMTGFILELLRSMIFLKIYFFYFWLWWVFGAALGLFSSCGEWGLLFIAVCGVLIVVTSLVVERRL